MPTPINPNNPNQPQDQEYDYSAYTGEQAQAVAQESYRIKDGGGGADILIPEVVGDFPRFQPSAPQTGERTYYFDIVMAPAGFKHPMVVRNRIQPDAKVHICWSYIHKSLGDGWWNCPARTWGQRCPACERRKQIMARSDLPDEAVKNLREPYDTGQHPSGMYNIIPHPNPQAINWQDQVMFWIISNFFMESHLQSKAKTEGVMDGTGYINYYYPTAGPQGGRHISVNIYKKGQYDDFKTHTFYQRQTPVPPHVLQQARCLSDFLYIGQSHKDKLLAGRNEPPTKEDWDVYYDELRVVTDIVADGQQQAAQGAGQPTGQGYAIGGGYESPSPMGGYQQPQPFGIPEPQGQFPQCLPLGSMFGQFQECDGCFAYIECQTKAAPPVQVQAPPPPSGPQPTTAPPQPAPAQPITAPEPQTWPATGPQPAPPVQPRLMPKRQNQ